MVNVSSPLQRTPESSRCYSERKRLPLPLVREEKSLKKVFAKVKLRQAKPEEAVTRVKRVVSLVISLCNSSGSVGSDQRCLHIRDPHALRFSRGLVANKGQRVWERCRDQQNYIL